MLSVVQIIILVAVITMRTNMVGISPGSPMVEIIITPVREIPPAGIIIGVHDEPLRLGCASSRHHGTSGSCPRYPSAAPLPRQSMGYPEACGKNIPRQNMRCPQGFNIQQYSIPAQRMYNIPPPMSQQCPCCRPAAYLPVSSQLAPAPINRFISVKRVDVGKKAVESKKPTFSGSSTSRSKGRRLWLCCCCCACDVEVD